jgi:hypothetical protein
MRERLVAEDAQIDGADERRGAVGRVPTVVVSYIWGPVASSSSPTDSGGIPMTTNPSTALVVYDPDRVDPEHVALAGFLGGYRGLTRDA